MTKVLLQGGVLLFLVYLYFTLFNYNGLLTSLAFLEWLLCADCVSSLWILSVVRRDNKLIASPSPDSNRFYEKLRDGPGTPVRHGLLRSNGIVVKLVFVTSSPMPSRPMRTAKPAVNYDFGLKELDSMMTCLPKKYTCAFAAAAISFMLVGCQQTPPPTTVVTPPPASSSTPAPSSSTERTTTTNTETKQTTPVNPDPNAPAPDAQTTTTQKTTTVEKKKQ